MIKAPPFKIRKAINLSPRPFHSWKGRGSKDDYPRRLTPLKHSRGKSVKSAKHRLRRQALDRFSQLCYIESGDGDNQLSLELWGVGQSPTKRELRVKLARSSLLFLFCFLFRFGKLRLFLLPSIKQLDNDILHFARGFLLSEILAQLLTGNNHFVNLLFFF